MRDATDRCSMLEVYVSVLRAIDRTAAKILAIISGAVASELHLVDFIESMHLGRDGKTDEASM